MKWCGSQLVSLKRYRLILIYLLYSCDLSINICYWFISNGPCCRINNWNNLSDDFSLCIWIKWISKFIPLFVSILVRYVFQLKFSVKCYQYWFRFFLNDLSDNLWLFLRVYFWYYAPIFFNVYFDGCLSCW